MDDSTHGPRRTPLSLLRYEERYAMSSTRQTRSKGGRVATSEVRPNVVTRVDLGAELMCVRILCTQLTRTEWSCWIALREGILFDAPRPGAISRTWFVVPPPATTASAEVCARHYGLSVASVERYERSARHLLHTIRQRAGLLEPIPAIPVWPAINSDANLLAYLFDDKREGGNIRKVVAH